MRLEQAAGRWGRPTSSRKVAVESPDGTAIPVRRTRWRQLAALSEVAAPHAQQESGAATNCDGSVTVLLRYDRVLDGSGSE